MQDKPHIKAHKERGAKRVHWCAIKAVFALMGFNYSVVRDYQRYQYI